MGPPGVIGDVSVVDAAAAGAARSPPPE